MSGSPSPESQITAASVLCRDAGIRFVLKFPRITKNGYLDTIFDAVKRTGPDIGGYLVENCGAVHACMNLDPSTVLYGSEGINIFNHIAACHLSALFKQVTLSPELSRDEIRGLIHEAKIQGCGTGFALIVQGNREVMVSEDCLLRCWLPCTGKNTEADNSRFFGIRDVSGDIFPVRVDGECRSHVYDSRELCLIEHLPSIRHMGVDEVVLDARGRNDRYIRDMTGIYRDAISLINKKKWVNNAHIEQWKDKIRRYAIGGITAGHFIRGLQE
jgi:putative protease